MYVLYRLWEKYKIFFVIIMFFGIINKIINVKNIKWIKIKKQ